MSTGNKSIMPINWQEVPDKELGLDEANPKDVAMAMLQEKFWCKWRHNEVKIFGAEGYLPKLALESKVSEGKLQETLREVEELEEECLEWVMERLQMRKGWMEQEEAALIKCLKGKGKEPAREEEQEEEEQGTGGEEGEGVTA
ncbi:hypothetical protein ID866_11029 [Astraeus odoratus]|nr:hypothetical protein ID866_11029 [Astraeus odoratus]